MSDYIQYTEEVEKIDSYLNDGYTVATLYENLSGLFVELQKDEQKETLHLLTADARKYFSVKLRDMNAS